MTRPMQRTNSQPIATAPQAPDAQGCAPPRIVAVLTCFNRKALTMACLEALQRSAQQAGAELAAVLLDDASPDETGDAVREHFPWVEVISGTGSLYWNRGMYVAFARALTRPADHYLWINDDTQLLPGALASLLAQAAELEQAQRRPVIMVGATAERHSGCVSYGGRVAASRIRPFHYHLVWSEREPVPCQTIEGNCVLIPRQVAQRVGNLDPLYEHAMGDTDYGLRAAKAGFGLFVARGVVGYCAPNALGGTHFDRSLPLAARWKLMRSRKGLPVRSWLHFCRRHGGWLWPLHFAWPYAKLLLSGLRAGARRRLSA
jgi:GT2 family glycosyltransferase